MGVFGLLSAGRTQVPVHMYEFFEPSVSITRQLLPSLKYQHLSAVRVYKGPETLTLRVLCSLRTPFDPIIAYLILQLQCFVLYNAYFTLHHINLHRVLSLASIYGFYNQLRSSVVLNLSSEHDYITQTILAL